MVGLRRNIRKIITKTVFKLPKGGFSKKNVYLFQSERINTEFCIIKKETKEQNQRSLI